MIGRGVGTIRSGVNMGKDSLALSGGWLVGECCVGARNLAVGLIHLTSGVLDAMDQGFAGLVVRLGLWLSLVIRGRRAWLV